MDLVPAFVRRLPSAVALLLLAGGAAAQATPMSVPWGQPFTINAKLGFGLSCPHVLEIVVENPSVCAPIDPPAETTKQAFPFDALAVGTSLVTLSFTGTGPCPGFATKSFEVTVEPDAGNTVSAFLKDASATGKALKTATSGETAEFKQLLALIRFDAQSGFISLAAGLEQMSDRAITSSVRGTNALHAPLVALSDQGSALMGVSGLTSLPRDLATGCDGAWDGAVSSQRGAYGNFQAGLAKEFGKSVKKLSKVNSALKASFAFGANALAPPVAGPSLDPPFGTLVVPPRFTLGIGYSVNANLGLTIGGYADATKTTVHLDLFGPDGYTASVEDEVTTVPGDAFGRFSWFLNSQWVKAAGAPADGELPVLFPGLYRAEVRYAEDTQPADVFYIVVP